MLISALVELAEVAKPVEVEEACYCAFQSHVNNPIVSASMKLPVLAIAQQFRPQSPVECQRNRSELFQAVEL